MKIIVAQTKKWLPQVIWQPNCRNLNYDNGSSIAPFKFASMCLLNCFQLDEKLLLLPSQLKEVEERIEKLDQLIDLKPLKDEVMYWGYKVLP